NGSRHSNCASSPIASAWATWSDVRPHFVQNHSWFSGFQQILACSMGSALLSACKRRCRLQGASFPSGRHLGEAGLERENYIIDETSVPILKRLLHQYRFHFGNCQDQQFVDGPSPFWDWRRFRAQEDVPAMLAQP